MACTKFHHRGLGQRSEIIELPIIPKTFQRTGLNLWKGAATNALYRHGYSHGDLAKTIGKSRSHVANMVAWSACLKNRTIADGKITAGAYARALLSSGSRTGGN